MDEFDEEFDEIVEPIKTARGNTYHMSVAFSILEDLQGQFMKTAPAEVVDDVIAKLEKRKEDFEVEDVEESTMIELMGGENLKKYIEANPNAVSTQISHVIRRQNGKSLGKDDEERLQNYRRRVHWEDGLELLQWIRDQILGFKLKQRELQGKSGEHFLRGKEALTEELTLQP